MNILEIRNLTKDFRISLLKRKKFRALNSVNFSVNEGGVFGILGPNGSGKTTLLLCVLNLLKYEGEIKISGHNNNDGIFNNEIGYMPEDFTFYDYLTGTEFLKFNAGLYGLGEDFTNARIEYVTKKLVLGGYLEKKLKTYSRGMLQRIGLAQAIMNKPKLLILDEPTSGLDPEGRKIVRDLLTEISGAGATILISSHILSDIEKICSDVIILNKGNISATGKMEQFLTKSGDLRVNIVYEGNDLPGYAELIKTDRGYKTVKIKTQKELADFIVFLNEKGGSVIGTDRETKSLEDFYIEVIKDKE